MRPVSLLCYLNLKLGGDDIGSSVQSRTVRGNAMEENKQGVQMATSIDRAVCRYTGSVYYVQWQLRWRCNKGKDGLRDATYPMQLCP